jgi:hypothetical protein
VTADAFPLHRVADLPADPPQRHWLVRDVWSRSALGVIGGAPKCGKSWLGLDLATSVASRTACLGRFAVDDPGPALVYLAEDSLPAVRARIQALCDHRGLDLSALDLFVIAIPVLRLDLPFDQRRLMATVEEVRPRLLLLDPLVRLHRLDENSSSEISGLLGFLRELQRTYDTAVALVHHASKKHRAQPGQALRGSSDLHAIGDSNAYLARTNDGRLLLTLEHRSARAPDPMPLDLVSRPDGSATHLELLCGAPAVATTSDHAVLRERALDTLRQANSPLRRADLRVRLRVNNERLGLALTQLEADRAISRTPDGWTSASAP